jgi:signal transduction histidine kinase
VPVLAAGLTADSAGDLAAGLALVGGGAAALAVRRRGTSAQLLLLTGVAWFAGDLWSGLLYVHRGPLAHLLLTYPTGRARPRIVAGVIAFAYADGLFPAVARAEVPTIALVAAMAAVAGWRYRVAGAVERRPRAAALAGVLALGTALTLAAVTRLAGSADNSAALWAYDIAVAAIGLGLGADLIWGRWARGAVTGLVIDLGDRHEPQALRAALAHALDDSGLEVAYRVVDGSAWVDEVGRPVTLPATDGERTVTIVDEDGDPVVALVHDPAALADRELAASVAAATRLAAASARMQVEIAERVREVETSRRRLLETADEERRRLGEQLRHGAQERLVAVSGRLARLAGASEGEPAAELSRLAAELDDAREDLSRFARGVHPRALTEHGLGAALRELAAPAIVPVALTVDDRRFDAATEAAAYFVCSEGLANVVKYARARRVEISVEVRRDVLMVRVGDDGAGGASVAAGSGLRGLADRVEALGGSLTVDSTSGAGTRLEAALPLADGDARIAR